MHPLHPCTPPFKSLLKKQTLPLPLFTHAGGVMDWGMVIFSTMVLIWLSAQLYRMYAFAMYMQQHGSGMFQ